MTSKATVFIVTITVLLAACSYQSYPHASEGDQTSAILKPMLVRDHWDRICVNPQLRPPLYEQRQQAGHEAKLRKWREWLDWMNPFKSRHTGYVQWMLADRNTGNAVLRPKESDHLERLLQQAIAAHLSDSMERIVPPVKASACTKADEQAHQFGLMRRGRLSFSRPVVVGNVAFVETSVVCGMLCGSGSLVSLIKRNGQWALLASQETWIS